MKRTEDTCTVYKLLSKVSLMQVVVNLEEDEFDPCFQRLKTKKQSTTSCF